MTARNDMDSFMIKKAEEMGFCSGVRRAIKIIEEAAAKNEKISSLGAIVHNQQVVNNLKNKGVELEDNPMNARNPVVAITSHGVGPDIIDELKKRGKKIVDTTCPNVQNAQRIVKNLCAGGFQVIIFGELEHPEVKGLLNWAGNKALVTLNSRDIILENLSKNVGILSQTTQSQIKYQAFTREVLDTVFTGVRELRIYNTLCSETIKRQDSALELAKTSDLVIVVGGLNSANTRRLADICSGITDTHLIETAGEIDPSWVKNKKQVGITAGASTPDETIEHVITRLNSFR